MQLPESPTNIVQTICHLARQEDVKALNLLLKNHCVGEFVDGTNAVMELAKEGNLTAITFLLTKYNANIDHAVIGAAQNGQLSLMMRLLAQGASKSLALGGAVLGNESNIINLLLDKTKIDVGNEQINSLLDRTKMDLSFAIECAASQVRLKAIYERLIEGKHCMDSDAGFGAAIEGAASNEDRAQVEAILAATQHVPIRLKVAIYGAAKAGKVSYYRELLSDPRLLNEVQKEALNCAMRGAAFRDSEEEIQHLLKQGAETTACIEGASTAGKLARVKAILAASNSDREKLILINRAAEYAVEGRHLDLLRSMLDLGADKLQIAIIASISGELDVLNVCAPYLTDLQINTLHFSSTFTIDDLLKAASLINSDAVRRRYFETNSLTLMQPYKEEFRAQWVEDLAQKTRVLNRLIRKYDLNYNQALAWNLPAVHVWLQPNNKKEKVILQEVLRQIHPLTCNEAEEVIEKIRLNRDAMRKHGFLRAKTEDMTIVKDEPTVNFTP